MQGRSASSRICTAMPPDRSSGFPQDVPGIVGISVGCGGRHAYMAGHWGGQEAIELVPAGKMQLQSIARRTVSELSRCNALHITSCYGETAPVLSHEYHTR